MLTVINPQPAHNMTGKNLSWEIVYVKRLEFARLNKAILKKAIQSQNVKKYIYSFNQRILIFEQEESSVKS